MEFYPPGTYCNIYPENKQLGLDHVNVTNDQTKSDTHKKHHWNCCCGFVHGYEPLNCSSNMSCGCCCGCCCCWGCCCCCLILVVVLVQLVVLVAFSVTPKTQKQLRGKAKAAVVKIEKRKKTESRIGGGPIYTSWWFQPI